MQNEERRKPPPFFNSAFSVLRSVFIVDPANPRKSCSFNRLPSLVARCGSYRRGREKTRMQHAECRMKNEESHRPFSILHSPFCVLYSSLIQPTPVNPAPSTACRHLLRGASRTGENEKKQECRTQNEERRKPPPF